VPKLRRKIKGTIRVTYKASNLTEVDQKSQWFFKPFLGVKLTLKFCDDTLNSESQDMVLPCIEAKRIEESMFSCPWLLQQMAAIAS